MSNCQDLCTAAKCDELENRIIFLENETIQLKILLDSHRVLTENLSNKVTEFENNFNEHINSDINVVHGNHNLTQLEENFNQHITTDIVAVHGRHNFKPNVEIALAIIDEKNLKVFIRVDIDDFGSDNSFDIMELDMNCDLSEVINTINIRATLTDTLILANSAQILFLQNNVQNIGDKINILTNDVNEIKIDTGILRKFLATAIKTIDNIESISQYNNNLLVGVEFKLDGFIKLLDGRWGLLLLLFNDVNKKLDNALIHIERTNILAEKIDVNIQDFYRQQIEYNERILELISLIPDKVYEILLPVFESLRAYLDNRFNAVDNALTLVQLSLAALSVAVGAIVLELAALSAALAAGLAVIETTLAGITTGIVAIRGALVGIEWTLAGIEGTLAEILTFRVVLYQIEDLCQQILDAIKALDFGDIDICGEDCIVTIIEKVTAILDETIEIKAELVKPIAGSLSSADCEEKPEDYSYNGQGLAGLANMITATSSILNKIRQRACEIEPATVIPDWWQVRRGQRSQAVIIYQEYDPATNKFLDSKWSLAIPYYRFPEGATPLIPDYKKGQIQGMLTLDDNSKIIVNCSTREEAARVLASLEVLVDPSMLQNKDSLIGERKGKALKTCTVKPRSIKFFEDGQRDTTPTWSQKIE